MADSTPNILLLLTDQQRFDTIAALGNPIIRTPVLDGLCEQGTAFTRCYTPSPVCVPARAALATGLPPHVTGCWDNGTNVDPQVPSLMQRLNGHGYQTHGIGKMHFTPKRTRMWGFDSRDVSERGDDDYRAFLNEQGYDYILDVHGSLREFYGVPQVSQMPAHLHESAWVADRSIDFLKRRDGDRPFFMWSSFFKPHPPFDAPSPWHLIYWAGQMPPPFRPAGYEELQGYWNHYQNRANYRGHGFDLMLMRTIKAVYYASISFIDYQIGRILQALGDEIDNTLVVFSSDHGEMLGDYGCVGKRCMFDAAARVPMVVRWPGAARAATRCDRVTSLLDLYPTMLTAAGDDDPCPHRDGRNLADVADGLTKRDAVYSQLQTRGRGLHMAVSETRKYVFSAADDREWMFDLRSDPDESHDFAGNDLYLNDMNRMRRLLCDRYTADGYTESLDQAGWRRFGKTSLSPHPDAHLMIQHPPDVADRLSKLGPYAPDNLPAQRWPGKAAAQEQKERG